MEKNWVVTKAGIRFRVEGKYLVQFIEPMGGTLDAFVHKSGTFEKNNEATSQEAEAFSGVSS